MRTSVIRPLTRSRRLLAPAAATALLAVGLSGCGGGDATSAPSEPDGSTSPGSASTAPSGSTSPTGNSQDPKCTPSHNATPAEGIKNSLPFVILDSTELSCADVVETISGGMMDPVGRTIPELATVAFVFKENVDAFRVGLQEPGPVPSGSVIIYRFAGNARYSVTINGPVAGDITVGTPVGGPGGGGLIPSGVPTSSSAAAG